MAPTVAGVSKQQLARALGATGVAFGLTSIVAPRAVAGTYGVPVTPAGLQLQRLFGSRPLGLSVLALAARTRAEGAGRAGAAAAVRQPRAGRLGPGADRAHRRGGRPRAGRGGRHDRDRRADRA